MLVRVRLPGALARGPATVIRRPRASPGTVRQIFGFLRWVFALAKTALILARSPTSWGAAATLGAGLKSRNVPETQATGPSVTFWTSPEAFWTLTSSPALASMSVTRTTHSFWYLRQQL